MSSWQDKYLVRALAVGNEAELMGLLESIGKALGFEYCAYFARIALPVTQPRNLFFSSAPGGWGARYMGEQLWQVDPVIAHGARSHLPIVWNDDLAERAPTYWQAAREAGLRFGWAQSCLDAAGARGVLIFARADGVLTDAELQQNNPQLSWATHVAHAAMMRLDRERFAPPPLEEPLSDREREVLRWTADGKTSGEVADILHITERTVNFHINRCVEKLQVNNKLAATVRAAMLGLL